MDEIKFRVQHNAIEFYEPHPKQKLFHLAKNEDGSIPKIRVASGGNQSGKTKALIAEAVAQARGCREWLPEDDPDYFTHPLPNKGLIVTVDFESHRDNILPYLMGDPTRPGMIPTKHRGKATKGQHGFVDRMKIRHIYGGWSEIQLKSYKQDADSFEGKKWNWIAWDEPPPRELRVAALRGLIALEGMEWYAMTPVSKFPERVAWVYDELYQSGKAWFMFMDIRDNPHLNEEQIQLFESSLNQDEIESRIKGRFMHLSGLVYKEFDPKVHVIKLEEMHDKFPGWHNWPKYCVVDPHDRKPWAIGWFCVDPHGRIFWYDEWPNEKYEQIRSCRMIMQEYVTIIREHEGRDRVYRRILDPNYGRRIHITSDSTIEDELLSFGLDFETDVNDALVMGHNKVREFLHFQRNEDGKMDKEPSMFFIRERCRNLIYGMQHYLWDEYRDKATRGLKAKPMDKNKDFPDLVRYGVMAEPTYRTAMFVSNPATKEKRGASGYGF